MLGVSGMSAGRRRDDFELDTLYSNAQQNSMLLTEVC